MATPRERFVLEKKGKKKGAVVSLRQYRRLMEDPHGLAVAAEPSRGTANSSQMPLDLLTRDLRPETRAVLSELAALIRSTIPEATQKVNLGRKSLNFSHPNVGYFCGLLPSGDRVVAAFQFGVLLADPDRVLGSRSCSRQVRYLPIHSVNAIPRPALKRLLRAAVSLPGERSTRIALVRAGAKPVVPKARTTKRAPS